MTANRFQVDGERIDSKAEFLRRENRDAWENLLYFPESFKSDTRHPIVFTGKTFSEVSFKDTDFERVRFIRCRFERCLLIGSSITDCEFIDCDFIDTNTSKLRVSRCLLDPACFEANFDLVDDTNIAIDLYHALYRNASEEHQPEYALQSLYRMKKAENAHLDSQKRRGVIGRKEYLRSKTGHVVYDFVSGYGLRTLRVLRLLLIVIVPFTLFNLLFSGLIFEDKSNLSLIDSLYFTCVTITTLGFGDITPTTPFGRLFVTFQALVGFIVISIFLAAVANSAIRAR